ncbi:MAG: hypothetical protein ACRELC_08125 [Gemmatimonadota bacterium]
MTTHDEQRRKKFRQAAFVYLHVAILYEATVWVLHGADRLPARGPVALWLLLGAAITAFVVWGLWSWQNAWLARIVWGLGAFRLPFLVRHAFVPGPDPVLPAAFYLTALVVVLINLAALARAGWDL